MHVGVGVSQEVGRGYAPRPLDQGIADLGPVLNPRLTQQRHKRLVMLSRNLTPDATPDKNLYGAPTMSISTCGSSTLRGRPPLLRGGG